MHGKTRQCTLKEHISMRIFRNDDLLGSMEDKRVENAHLKIHKIQSNFQFMVELAMHGGH